MSLHVINLPEPTHSVAPLGRREERMGEERREVEKGREGSREEKVRWREGQEKRRRYS